MWLDDRPTALYRLFSKDGALLYVGVTIDIDQRWASHERSKPWWPQVEERRVEWYANRPLALAAELNAIQTERPLHNISGTPTAHKRRELKQDEVPSGVLRAQLSKYMALVRAGGTGAVIVDGTQERKRVAALVDIDFYERALAALGETPVPAKDESA